MVSKKQINVHMQTMHSAAMDYVISSLHHAKMSGRSTRDLEKKGMELVLSLHKAHTMVSRGRR